MSRSVEIAQAFLAGQDIGMPASDLVEDLMHEVVRLDHERSAEREACAQVAEMHENYVRDYSREVFARRIAAQIRKGEGPAVRELEFARSIQRA